MTQNVELALAEINATRVVLDQIANKWSILILTVLCPQPARFNQLKKRLDPITHKALTEALRRLEKNGLINRRVIASSPVAVEYSITELGRSLKDPFVALVQWASRYSESITTAQQEYAEKNAAESSSIV